MCPNPPNKKVLNNAAAQSQQGQGSSAEDRINKPSQSNNALFNRLKK